MTLGTNNNNSYSLLARFMRFAPLTLLLCFSLAANAQPRQTLEDKDCSNPHGSYECLVDSLWQNTIQWLNAWADHDTEAYFGCYAPQVSPLEGVSYEKWRAQRTDRVGRDRPLKLGVNFLDAEVLEDRKVRLLFIQRYDSGSYADIVLKTLVYQLLKDEFLIVEEIVHQTLSEQDAQTILENIK